jgi:hypothetical protein
VYSIGFSSQPADDEAEAAFDVVKSSWAWTSWGKLMESQHCGSGT